MKFNRHLYLLIGIILLSIGVYRDFYMHSLRFLAFFYCLGGCAVGNWIGSFFKSKE